VKSSFNWFCNGVPVKSKRRFTFRFFKIKRSLDLAFLRRWPSSMMRKCQDGREEEEEEEEEEKEEEGREERRRVDSSRRRISYVVRTTRGGREEEEEEGGEEEARAPAPLSCPSPLLLAGRPKCSFITFLKAIFLASFSPRCEYTLIDGAQFLSSSSQLLSTERGRTMRCGPRMP
jgi:hypothetical protein